MKILLLSPYHAKSHQHWCEGMMTDLNGIIGFTPELARVPSILYFHENQFAYPINKNVGQRIEPMLVPTYSALTADFHCFNTNFNYGILVDGVGKWLQ